MAIINLENLYQQVFGAPMPDKFTVPQSPARTELSPLGSPYYATDLLGREYFMPVWLQGVFTNGTNVAAFDYLVPFAVVGINTKKNVKKTPMPQRGGSVKEIINIDDYVINIKGIIVNESNDFPAQDVMNMQGIFLINQSITIRSAMTDIFLNGAFNHRAVIMETKWPQTPGSQHTKAFDMELESDMIFDLIIN